MIRQYGSYLFSYPFSQGMQTVPCNTRNNIRCGIQAASRSRSPGNAVAMAFRLSRRLLLDPIIDRHASSRGAYALHGTISR